MSFVEKSKLPRLSREWYQGRAVVFWTHTIEGRATGWLDETFHSRFREVMVHAGWRFGVVCPSYVLMPDHWHVVWMGFRSDSDQRDATRFLRKHLARGLRAPVILQDRAHDSVLRDEQRKRGAFAAACGYVQMNPVRAGLVTNWEEWAYAGAIVPGYPDFNPRTEAFWDDLWKIYNRLVSECV